MKTINDIGEDDPFGSEDVTSESLAFFQELGSSSLPAGEFHIGPSRIPLVGGGLHELRSNLNEFNMRAVLCARHKNEEIQGTCERVKDKVFDSFVLPDGGNVTLFVGANTEGEIGVNAIGCEHKTVKGICDYTREQCKNAGSVPVLPIYTAFWDYH